MHPGGMLQVSKATSKSLPSTSELLPPGYNKAKLAQKYALQAPPDTDPLVAKRRICELLGGKPFDVLDAPLVFFVSPTDISYYLTQSGFLEETERNRKRANHVVSFNTAISIKMGIDVVVPANINHINNKDTIFKRTILRKFGYDFIKHAIALALEIGVRNTSRLLGITEADVNNWMHSDEGKIKSIRDEMKARFVSKGCDVLDTYMDRLLDEEVIKKAPAKDIALVIGTVHDKMSSLIKGSFDDLIPSDVVGGPDAVNIKEVTNIVNVLISDSKRKEELQDDILTQMGLSRNTVDTVNVDNKSKSKLLSISVEDKEKAIEQ